MISNADLQQANLESLNRRFLNAQASSAIVFLRTASDADVQWALHNAKTPSDLAVKYKRGEKTSDVKIALKEGWRRADDITWRTTTWELRRMAAGGIKFDPVPDNERGALKLEKGKLALLIKHLGAYGEHAAAMQASRLAKCISRRVMPGP